jgi:hypothetical protein|tara:strand:+ start:235 stop:639 length:405 start_codon:yes stop_codon:yes gene_type:complete
MSSTVTMLTDGAALSFTGDKVRGDGYYGYNDGLHTIAIDVQDFKARVYLQGTLSTNPVEADWFDIQLASSTDYIQFPADAGNLLGGGTNGDTITKGYTFQGNFVYLRAKVDRTWIDPTPDLANVGVLNKIQLNI